MYDIEIKDLSLYYGTLCVLKNINLKVDKNDFLGIIGPNGGGKTTLLKVILKLANPTTGTVNIKEGCSIGYVPQISIFNRRFPISVLDVVLTGKLSNKVKFMKKYSNEDRTNAIEIIQKLGITSQKNKQIGQLSIGQLQKVLIARALMTNPGILILDEPTASLDVKARKEIYNLLKKLSEDKTILIVSHDMKEIFSYVKNLAYIDKTLDYYNNQNKNYRVHEKIYDRYY